MATSLDKLIAQLTLLRGHFKVSVNFTECGVKRLGFRVGGWTRLRVWLTLLPCASSTHLGVSNTLPGCVQHRCRQMWTMRSSSRSPCSRS